MARRFRFILGSLLGLLCMLAFGWVALPAANASAKITEKNTYRVFKPRWAQMLSMLEKYGLSSGTMKNLQSIPLYLRNLNNPKHADRKVSFSDMVDDGYNRYESAVIKVPEMGAIELSSDIPGYRPGMNIRFTIGPAFLETAANGQKRTGNNQNKEYVHWFHYPSPSLDVYWNFGSDQDLGKLPKPVANKMVKHIVSGMNTWAKKNQKGQ